MKLDVLISIEDTNMYFKILNCFLTNGFDGIYLKNVDHGFISNNTITNNSGYGIFLNKSRNNVILSNNINMNRGGVEIGDSVNSSLINNTISSGRGIISYSSNSSKLTGNTIFNCQEGVFAMLCLKFTLTGNKIFNCSDGVYAIGCAKLILIGNNISDISHSGIHIDSYNSHISGNFVSNCKYVGILVGSRNNTIKNNILQDNGIYFMGSQLQNFLQFSIENNSVNGRPIFYSQDVNGGIVPNGVGQVILVNCTDLIVTAQDLSNGSFGLLGIFSQNISIENNIISNNSANGIDLYNSDNCTISGNSFFKNEYLGIMIRYSSDNKILWNDFIGNNDHYWAISQACDTGLRNLFSCNYWDDWVSPDDNSDGIVDQEYIIEGGSHNSDSRPLVSRNRSPHDLIGLSLLFPNGGNILNGTVAICWKPVLNSRMDPCFYSFYVSSDNGTSWNYIFETQKFSPTQCIIEFIIFWTTSTSPNGFNYLIKVVAENSEGLQVEDTSDAMFIILNPPPPPPPPPTVRIFLFLLIVLILLVTLRFHPRRPK